MDEVREEARVLAEAAECRGRALTREQRERRELVARRTAIISAGVRPPVSGIFGRPKAPPKQKRAA